MRASRLRMLAAVAVAYLAAAGAALWLWLGHSAVATPPLVVAVCFAPAVLAAVLAGTSLADPTQYIARILACAAFTPILLLFWGTSLDPAVTLPDRRIWPFAVAAATGHAAAFVGLIFWGGSFATRVAAAPGVAASSQDTLRARLLSLGQAGVPFALSANPGPGLVATLDNADAARSHRVLLDFEPAHHIVRVREKLSASAARPRDADEASMRGPGDPHFDPTRPTATRVSGKTVQTSMIDAQRLAAMPVRLVGPSAELPADVAAALDPDGVVTLLCAVVTRSGWHWQPVFFASADS
jgi:hypothetical protein